ncbi:hypothetical protein HQ394_15315 [Defluviicoccus vanus]|uniref:Galactose oxidase n=1 Tax=Defluviicoccus vanus TaxID=111831 RepID=A0A7H1N411_9PROT|nr:hypothetical protein HQ394_15315 [Defluviicoccus vanus]
MGKVIVVGGGSYGAGGDQNLASAELYDSSTGHWTTTGAMSLARYWGEQGYSIQQLSDGSVLIVGGTTCCPYRF